MNRFRRVLLANPPKTHQAGYIPSPLAILYLAAYLRKEIRGVKVEVIDGALDGEVGILESLQEFKADLVGVSVLTPNRHQALKIAGLVKRFNPKCKVVFGGIHPTLMWKQMMENYPEIDYIVRGEGEITLHELVSGKKLKEIRGLVRRGGRGSIINNSNQMPIRDLDSLPFPARDLVDISRYSPGGEGIVNGIDLEKEVRHTLIFSRGCMGACTFCSSWMVWRGYRTRSGKNAADEVEHLVREYQAKHICFYDDTLTGDREEIINFCREVISRKLRVAIFGNTRVDRVDEEMLRWMKRAGFFEIAYGIESGSPAMLLKINKRIDLENIKKAIKLTKKVGMKATALMMYGMPSETQEDRELTDKLLDEINPDAVGSLGAVWIFPGTALHEQAKHAGLISDRFWLGKRPYYIYRGGIGGDPIQWKLKIYDTLKYYFSDTVLNKTRVKLLVLWQTIFQKRLLNG